MNNFDGLNDFIDELGTRFIRQADDSKYDYKMIIQNADGTIEEDYCMLEQLFDWHIQIVSVLDED